MTETGERQTPSTLTPFSHLACAKKVRQAVSQAPGGPKTNAIMYIPGVCVWVVCPVLL
jgi:hypothetical protein